MGTSSPHWNRLAFVHKYYLKKHDVMLVIYGDDVTN